MLTVSYKKKDKITSGNILSTYLYVDTQYPFYTENSKTVGF